MRYAAYETLIAPARTSAELWRLVLGVIVAGAVFLGLTRAFFAIARMVMEPDAFWSLAADFDAATTPRGMLLLLLLMGTMGIGALVAAETVHRRQMSSLFGPWPLFFRQFIRVTAALVVLFAVIAILPPWPIEGDLQPGLPAGLWLTLLPISLIALLVQTASEELLFRGYIQSQLAARFAHPAVWLTLPSALFALGHYAPDIYGSNALPVALWAFVFGLAAADLTARAGTLGPAIALHLVNNTTAILLTALQGDMSGLALYQLSFGPEDEAALRALLPLDLAAIGLAWLAARLAIRA